MLMLERVLNALCTASWQAALLAGIILLVLGLSACGGSEFDEGEVGFIEGFFGGIIVDEPRAALIGRDVLYLYRN